MLLTAPLRRPRTKVHTKIRAKARAKVCLLTFGVGACCAAGTAAAQVTFEARSKGGFVVPESASPPAGETATQALAAAPSTAAATAGAAATLPAATQALLDEINRRRAEGATCGSQRKAPAPPMRWSVQLLRAAESHVRDMARQPGGIGHAGSDGSTVGTRVGATGYDWRSVGENVAAGRPTALATLAQWMASPGHCANIMNPGFAEVAVAGLNLPGTAYNHYWVMVLARR